MSSLILFYFLLQTSYLSKLYSNPTPFSTPKGVMTRVTPLKPFYLENDFLNLECFYFILKYLKIVQ